MFAPLLYAAAIGVALVTALALVGQAKHRANRFLAAVLLFIALDLTNWVAQKTNPETPLFFLAKLAYAGGFALGPCLYLYVESAMGRQIGRHRAWHFLPAVLALGLVARLDTVHWLRQAIGPAADVMFQSLQQGHQLLYTGFVYFAYRRFRRALRDQVSQIDGKNSLAWVRNLSLLSVLIAAFATLNVVTGSTIASNAYPGVTLLVVYIAYMALTQEHADLSELTAPVPSDEAPRPDQDMSAFTQLDERMTQDKLYLDSLLTIRKLAKQVHIPARELSRLINSSGKNFYDFVNSYRIAEAKDLLVRCPERTALDIAYAVGFNSKSTFYTAFRRFVGTTPRTFAARKARTPTQLRRPERSGFWFN